MKKNILFYKLNLVFNSQLNMFTTDTDLKSRVKAFAKNCDKNEMSYTNESQNYIVDIIEINEDYLFGSYGNLNNYSKSNFIRVRDKQNLSPHEYKDYLEMFTYFYIDFNTNKIVNISSRYCRGFKINIAEFLNDHFNLSEIYSDIKVVSTLKNDIKEAINKAVHVQEIDIKYYSDKHLMNEFVSLADIDSEDSGAIKSARLTLSLEPVSASKSIAQKLLNSIHDKGRKYKSVSITTDDGEIDVLEQTVTKKVSCDFEEGDFDEDSILNKLQKIISFY